MELYAAIDDTDPFTPAARAFEALKTDLAGPMTAERGRDGVIRFGGGCGCFLAGRAHAAEPQIDTAPRP